MEPTINDDRNKSCRDRRHAGVLGTSSGAYARHAVAEMASAIARFGPGRCEVRLRRPLGKCRSSSITLAEAVLTYWLRDDLFHPRESQKPTCW